MRQTARRECRPMYRKENDDLLECHPNSCFEIGLPRVASRENVEEVYFSDTSEIGGILMKCNTIMEINLQCTWIVDTNHKQ